MTATLLFDLDGTIVETDDLHYEAFKSVLTPYGVDLDWDTYKGHILGKNNPAIAADFLAHVPEGEHAAIMDAKEADYRARLHKIEAASGLLGLLDWARSHGVSCAVVTNAPRLNADVVLAGLGLRDRFKVLVIGPELAQAKPHPLPYLTALTALGGDAERSIGFEDSLSGARSAVAAGLGVVGLTSSLDAATLEQAGVHVTGRDFTDPAILRFVQERTGLGT